MILAALTGPTACGKTAIAEELSREFSLQLISMDSTHPYRFFDIGLAKPKMKELYWGIDTHHPLEKATVKHFVDLVTSTTKPSLIVGGSYFYLNVLLTGLNQVEPVSDEELERVNRLSEAELKDLLEKHPDLPTDPYRRQRDLAYLLARGFIPQKKDYDEKRTPILHPEIPVFEINVPRALTQERAVERIKKFFEQGLIQETRRNLNLGFGNSKAMGAIGYKECKAFLEDKDFPLERSIKKNTNRLIRMQATWSNKFKNLIRRDFEETRLRLREHLKSKLQ